MTSQQAAKIEELQKAGLSASTIAKAMEIPLNTVKSYLRRNLQHNEDPALCQVCGKKLKQIPHKRKKKFCSDRCRMDWWNGHPDRVNRKALYEYTCPCCGKRFTVYGNSHRTYCSHACYISSRYGGVRL